jgi:hypothetical protein
MKVKKNTISSLPQKTPCHLITTPPPKKGEGIAKNMAKEG